MRDDAEGGVNSFIAAQVKEPGEALLTLVWEGERPGQNAVVMILVSVP